jgi:RNA polymerase sigma factor (sigma-70 family)
MVSRGLYIGLTGDAIKDGGREKAGASQSHDEFTKWIEPSWRAMTVLALRLAGRNDYEDVLQEAVTLAWRKRASFDASRGTSRSWLLALTADCARRAYRRSRLYRSAPLDEVLPDSDASNGEVRIDVERAIRSLPRRQRLAVELFYFADLPVAEVACVMSCSEGTVKSTLSDARRRLRDRLETIHVRPGN